VRRVHQGLNDRFPDSRFEIEDRIVAGADRIIAECPQDRVDLIHYYAADPYRIAVVPCGIDPEEMAPVPRASARSRLGLAADDFIVLQIGRLVPRKGVATAVEGYARFCREAGPSRLVVVGGESDRPDPVLTPEIARLRSIARSVGVEGRTVFTGRREREVLRHYYSAADVFVTLPWYEPFGITPLEAMCCGLPVIGSRVGGIKYTVQDGITGCLIPAADPDALAQCLARLYRDRRLANALGRRGRRRALQRFTWDRVVRQIEAVYEDVLQRAGRLRLQDASRAVQLAGVPQRKRKGARASAAYATPSRH
jgi:D-inositol-3-phosphate glycosyltransferase